MLDRREMQTDILSLMKSWISCSNIFKILVDMNYEPLLCACDFCRLSELFLECDFCCFSELFVEFLSMIWLFSKIICRIFMLDLLYYICL